jgi:hypothetical protein
MCLDGLERGSEFKLHHLHHPRRLRDTVAVFVTACAHHVGGECTNALALPLYGASPSAGVCRVCAHYDGPDRGLGDTVHRVARATGVSRVVHAIAGVDCGCAQRRADLNAAVPFDDGSTKEP